jgi:ankyrin repeat protein
LVSKGADVSTQNNDGNTSLIAAALGGHTETVDSLLAQGADVNIQTNDNETALIKAANKGHSAIVNSLLAKGADVNIHNIHGNTALICAAAQGHSAIVDSLLTKGADVDVQDTNGNTALISAANRGHKEIVDSLMSKDPDMNIQNHSGDTALIFAAEKGHTPIVNSLLAKGAEVNVRGKNGDTALILAAKYGCSEIVNSLLAKGAEVNVQGQNGDTALILAAKYGRSAIVNSLLAKGADTNVRNKDGDTALTIASSKGYKAIVDTFLAKKGAVEQGRSEQAKDLLPTKGISLLYFGRNDLGKWSPGNDLYEAYCRYILAEMQRLTPGRVLISGGGKQFQKMVVNQLRQNANAFEVHWNEGSSLSWLRQTVEHIRHEPQDRKVALVSNFPPDNDRSLRLYPASNNTMILVFVVGMFTMDYIQTVYNVQASGRKDMTMLQVIAGPDANDILNREFTELEGTEDAVKRARLLNEIAKKLERDPSTSAVARYGGVLL